MALLQLNPPIPLNTRKGKGMAWIVIDEGVEHNLVWVVALQATGQIWCFQNPDVRAERNWTYGRLFPESFETVEAGSGGKSSCPQLVEQQ